MRRIRESVFMQEQQVPADLEWDGEDEGAIHLLAYDDTHSAIGCARVLADGHIGRMAVLKPWRDNGVGSALLREAIAVVREFGCDVAFLDAQCEAIPFYQREHFVAEGEVFLDAGIPHRKMRLPLSLEAAGY
ncbi:MAG: GNAT family N-acetyltransferase [Chromatiales bacterium]|nr:GNAT family N-acetyltransferase [Chromatiales bacterium]